MSTPSEINRIAGKVNSKAGDINTKSNTFGRNINSTSYWWQGTANTEFLKNHDEVKGKANGLSSEAMSVASALNRLATQIYKFQ